MPVYRKSRLLYFLTMSYSALHPRYVSVLVHKPCQLHLSSFLKLEGVFSAAEEAKADINAIKEH